jgi:hypothetical protein
VKCEKTDWRQGVWDEKRCFKKSWKLEKRCKEQISRFENLNGSELLKLENQNISDFKFEHFT